MSTAITVAQLVCGVLFIVYALVASASETRSTFALFGGFLLSSGVIRLVSR